MNRALLSLFLVLGTLLAPAAWGASTSSNAASSADEAAKATEAARRHFDRGARLYKQARYREAIGAFEAAYQARSHGVILFNIAQCHEKLGDLAAAWKSYDAYLKAIPDAEDRETVTIAMQNLQRRLAERGVQRLRVNSVPEGATVSVDGKAVGTTPFSGEIAQGPHHVAVERRGYAILEREVFLTPDSPVELDLTLLRASDAPLVEASPGISGNVPARPTKTPAGGLGEVSTKPAGGSVRTWTWVGAGLTGAALVTAAIFGASAHSASNELRDGTIRNRAEADRLRDAAVGRSTTANVLYGVAGVAAASTAALFFVEGEF